MGRTEVPVTRCGPAVRASSARTSSTSRTWDGEGAPAFPGGLHYADDNATCFLQGSTQYDALGHVWYDGQIWNGYDAQHHRSAAMEKACVLPSPRRASSGAACCIDMARYRGKESLDKGETFTTTTSRPPRPEQGVEIQKHDILIIRTGWIEVLYELNDRGVVLRRLRGAGPDLLPASWWSGSTTWRSRTWSPTPSPTRSPSTPYSGVALPLHCALMRNLGVDFTEIAWLDDLADACAADRRGPSCTPPPR